MRISTPTPPEDEAVKTAQTQLLRVGYSLPRYGADGLFGRETSSALTRFQRAHGLPQTGAIDEQTLQALEKAPSPSPAYDELFRDGVLKTVVAVGYDEAASHLAESADLINGLTLRGYTEATPDQRVEHGLDPAGRYLINQINQGTVIIELITPELPEAKTRFAQALRKNELVLYGGHGRYGSGPDFDDIHSPAGNFVIGQPFESGHVTLGPSDLQTTPLSPAYQLMFFDGCNTFHYFEELRAKKGSKTLDVIGSTTELYWNVTASNLLTMLDGVTEQQNLAQLEASLDAVNRAGADQAGFFRGDGFEDN